MHRVRMPPRPTLLMLPQASRPPALPGLSRGCNSYSVRYQPECSTLVIDSTVQHWHAGGEQYRTPVVVAGSEASDFAKANKAIFEEPQGASAVPVDRTPAGALPSGPYGEDDAGASRPMPAPSSCSAALPLQAQCTTVPDQMLLLVSVHTSHSDCAAALQHCCPLSHARPSQCGFSIGAPQP